LLIVLELHPIPKEPTMAFFAQPSRRTIQNDISDLSAEVARLAERASAAAGGAGETANGWLSSQAPSYADMRSMADDGASALWREAGRAFDGAEHQIRRRPAAAALALVGIGVLLGLMAKR